MSLITLPIVATTIFIAPKWLAVTIVALIIVAFIVPLTHSAHQLPLTISLSPPITKPFKYYMLHCLSRIAPLVPPTT
jgi:hypothetical protein